MPLEIVPQEIDKEMKYVYPNTPRVTASTSHTNRIVRAREWNLLPKAAIGTLLQDLGVPFWGANISHRSSVLRIKYATTKVLTYPNPNNGYDEALHAIGNLLQAPRIVADPDSKPHGEDTCVWWIAGEARPHCEDLPGEWPKKCSINTQKESIFSARQITITQNHEVTRHLPHLILRLWLTVINPGEIV
ncbi:hypothetical protein NM208_g15592 [Fusarium decemcellulare]|uniref:Uncharacterized protein n=1 Tax=Fusarium decemcellulare TaxID=57161 RepID=A0ACC1RF81_9HYPO|nr:hypothetical protein NM208_g15592 [Fusarium decemcellulare]